jgi:hypothetical protein
MEKDRSSRGSQHQFSIYSNKGGIIVKEEVSSEKAFTKAVKEVCIDQSVRPLMERNVSPNFDHSVVDGVLAIELAREPAMKNLSGLIESDKEVSGSLKSSEPIKMKKLGADGDSAEILQITIDEVCAALNRYCFQFCYPLIPWFINAVMLGFISSKVKSCVPL